MSIWRETGSRTRLRVLLGIVVLAVLATAMFAIGLANTRTDSQPSIDDEILAADTRLADGVGENDFIPADRDISDCISAIPKPGCGSDARGGWRQAAVLLAILVALAVILWRIVVSSRRARAAQLGQVASSAPRR